MGSNRVAPASTTPSVQVAPWPAEPPPGADAAERLAWYAAVARWAPSKHNAQPWRFVVRDHWLELHADPERALPATDPQRRELTIGCGAALHLACVAARALGQQPGVWLLPGGSDDLLARVAEIGPWHTTPDDRELLAAVPLRRTDRGPLDAERLPPGLPFQLQSAAADEGASLHLVQTPGDRSTLAALVERADRVLVQRAEVDAELAQWRRAPGDPRPDGVPADHTRGASASYRATFVQRDFSAEGARPAHDRPGPDRPVIGVLCTPGDRTADWLYAGQALAAVLLRATVGGANASYLNQPVEDEALRGQLRDQLRLPGVAQLVLRLGAGADIAVTARRPVDDVVVRER